MRPVLIIDDQSAGRYQELGLHDWVEAGQVEFHDTVDANDLDPDDYATAFIHQSNENEYEWAKKSFAPVFFFSGSRVSEPAVKRHMYFMSRQFFLERLPRVLNQIRATGKIDIQLFEHVDGSESTSSTGPPSSLPLHTVDLPEKLITFHSPDDEATSDRSFPMIVDTETTDTDFVATLEPLAQVESASPILLQETYAAKRDGVELLLRIRLSAAFTGCASRFPIYVKLDNPATELLRRNIKYSILLTKGVQVIDSVDAISDDEDDATLSPAELDAILDQLPIRPDPQTDHHDLSNAWGALRLWRGYQLLQGEGAEMPQELVRHRKDLLQREYYAYLASRSALKREGATRVQEDTAAIGAWRQFLKNHSHQAERPLRILLIDDEAEKGWEDALSAVLKSEVSESVDLSVYPSGQVYNHKKALKEATSEKWDLVLCDLRLSLWKDKELTSDTDPSKRTQYSGIDLVREIKQQIPDTPVIAFTASKTVWTTRAAENAGADGYWVKESPERAADDEYSKRNVADLYHLIRQNIRQRQGYSFLWSLIDDVQEARNNHEYLRVFQQLDSSENIKERLESIEHLLRRAYGLLLEKPTPFRQEQYNYEQEDFVDLAFLHIWGGINEVLQLRIQNVQDGKCRMIRFSGECNVYWNGTEEIPEAGWIKDEVDKLHRENKRISPSAKPRGRGSDFNYVSLLLKEGEYVELDQAFDRCKEVRNKIDVIHGHAGASRERVTTDDHLKPLTDIVRATLLLPD